MSRLLVFADDTKLITYKESGTNLIQNIEQHELVVKDKFLSNLLILNSADTKQTIFTYRN